MKWLRNIVITYLTKNLLKAVTAEDILLVSGKEWILNKRKLTREEVLSLKEEAAAFHESILYKLMVRELKYGVTLQRYDKAKTPDDMIFGKAMAYSISKIDEYINRMKAL